MKPTQSNVIHLFLLALLAIPLQAEEVWGARFPAPSPDGSMISFSYYGDIWIVPAGGGRAERLTVSSGYEGTSYWSPDGKWIAFVTDRWGSDDICIIPSDGSTPAKRLTYYSVYDDLFGWTPDGKYLVFESQRQTLRPSLYQISIDGGLPEMLTTFTARDVCFTPDGAGMYYVRGGAAWWRRRYRGSASLDIWFKELPDGESRRIAHSPGRDGYPMYSALDGELYFLSNRADGVNNLWSANREGANLQQLTFERDDIHFPEMSWDGSTIVYECYGSLCRYDVATGEQTEIQITATEDHKENPFYLEHFTGKATEFALSPDEQELAFVVHGDIFVMQLKDGKPENVVRLTDTPFIEKYVAWHPEKELLVYASMEDGDMDICTITPKTEEKFHDDLLFTSRKLLDTDESEAKPLFSPDGKMIAYFKNREQLYVMDQDGKQSRKLCPHNDVLWIDWSPDSKWITFSRTPLGWREDIFIVRADGSTTCTNISNHPNDDYKPMWSSDGRRIAYASRDAVGNLWMKYIFLRKEDEQKEPDYWETEEQDSGVGDRTVEIDFEDFEDRTHIVTKVLGWYNYVAQSPDGKQFALYSNNQESNDIWTVDWRGKELKRVTNTNVRPTMFCVTSDKKKILYLSGTGNIFSADIASTQSAPLSFNVEIGIDRRREREQVFNEAWWALQDGFYDSDFHGVDWRAMYHKYRDRALHTRTTRDFHSIVRMMLGELNASHLGIYQSYDMNERTGALGIIYDPQYTGDGVKVAAIIRDSPVDKEDINIKPGDIITHINGSKIARGDNFYSFLCNKSGEDIMLTVRGPRDERDVKVRPKTPWALLQLVKEHWVKANQDSVHEKSNGRIGYLYIASMGGGDLRAFEHDLYLEMDKDGLIIDIRYNGGGNIHDELINILRRTAYMYSIERGEDKEYYSLFRWDKPTVLIINENCYSDAEIFPAAFKELELGTVVGVPTFGAVIGTRDIHLLDGSGFRIPGTGWVTLTGENLENTPVEPDVYVENTPEMDGSSADHQLTRALEILMEEISK